MNVMLGNLTARQIEKRVGVPFGDDVIEMLDRTHQDRAENVQEGKWHCFDIPFQMVCGDLKTARAIYDALKPFAGDFAQPLPISLDGSAQ